MNTPWISFSYFATAVGTIVFLSLISSILYVIAAGIRKRYRLRKRRNRLIQRRRYNQYWLSSFMQRGRR